MRSAVSVGIGTPDGGAEIQGIGVGAAPGAAAVLR
jgi:hypothetical protein